MNLTDQHAGLTQMARDMLDQISAWDDEVDPPVEPSTPAGMRHRLAGLLWRRHDKPQTLAEDGTTGHIWADAAIAAMHTEIRACRN